MSTVSGRLRDLTRVLHSGRRIVVIPLLAAASITLTIMAANAWVLLNSPGDTTDRVADVPHVQAAIVLGALVEPSGEMSNMLTDRVVRAGELYRAGKVDRILVSGDHLDFSYDEPDTMRIALQRAGVPGKVIFTDHAGADTWASMVRARDIFGIENAVVVTQGFHLPRALYLAEAAGIDATGFEADRRDYGKKGAMSTLREFASRIKALGDVTFDRDVTGGPKIPITGDGRASWGPAPPPGTPPAGAPR